MKQKHHNTDLTDQHGNAFSPIYQECI